jgi:hypothetical protein
MRWARGATGAMALVRKRCFGVWFDTIGPPTYLARSEAFELLARPRLRAIERFTTVFGRPVAGFARVTSADIAV